MDKRGRKRLPRGWRPKLGAEARRRAIVEARHMLDTVGGLPADQIGQGCFKKRPLFGPDGRGSFF